MRCSQIENQNCDGAADRLPIKPVGQGSRDWFRHSFDDVDPGVWAERIKKGKLNLPIPSFYDIVPVSLGIVTVGGVIKFIIRKGTEVSARRPIVTTSNFWVGQTNQTFSLLDIYAGQRTLPKYCRKVQSFYLSG
jgi:molecular chaperone DnaK (HSP70)